MAGIVPLSGRSGRKQWTLHDGPRGSLRRLRSQLAEDGCPESQVVLAKQLLEERCGNSFHFHLSIHKGLQDVTGLHKLIVYA